MGSLTITKAGLVTSLQDMGRKGLAFYAVPTSGIMDKNAARIAQLLLNLPESSPVIECTAIAPEIQFHQKATIALSGANFNWKINNEVAPLHTVLQIQAGDILKGKFAADGLRGYIAIKGKFNLTSVFNSIATDTNVKIGGLNGQLLQVGDIIEWEDSSQQQEIEKIIIKKGPEYSYLTTPTQLTETIYKVHPDTNRMGLRTLCEPLESSSFQLTNSCPILPGFIQLPPSGQPIIILQDGQTTGGYPRIAYVPSNQLSKLNQIRLGGEFRFKLE